MSAVRTYATWTQAEWVAELRERFGDSYMAWAFQCPACGDIATGQDMTSALAANPRTRTDGSAVSASDVLAQECYGRLTGALDRTKWKGWDERKSNSRPKWKQRGCDWAAFGLFSIGDTVTLPDGGQICAFPMALAPTSAAAR